MQASDSENVTGTIVQDVISIAGLAAPSFQFGLIEDQSAGFGNDPFDGIVGMAFPGDLSVGSSTLIAALNRSGEIDGAMYGLYLAPEDVGGGEITLGGVDEAKFNGEVNYVPVNSTQGLFIIPFESVYVDDKDVGVGNATAITDSGTANMVAPTATDAEAIYALISTDIKPVDDKGTYGIPCESLDSIEASGKANISFVIGGKNYTIPSKELSVGPLAGQTELCQTLISAGGGYWIIGASLLKYYYSVWDLGGERFGLAATAHSPV